MTWEVRFIADQDIQRVLLRVLQGADYSHAQLLDQLPQLSHAMSNPTPCTLARLCTVVNACAFDCNL